jgi:hypothetical protein
MAERPAPLIYVSIASYRDRELQWTIRDLFAQAADPDRIRVGVCWQFLPGEDDDHFSSPTRPEQVTVRAYDARASKGAGWARAIAHGMRDEEPFVLQLDSHMRLHRGWDTQLLRLLLACPSDRPVLSTYPAPYEPDFAGGHEPLVCGSYMLTPRGFDAHGMLTFQGVEICAPVPIPCAWLAGGLMFAPAEFFVEVPYDPRVYFIGEEVSLAARGWTRGWDYFAPNECVAHHFYGRQAQSKHWTDHTSWSSSNRDSMARVRHLLGITREPPSVVDGLDGPLGLGSERSLREFERFAGVDFRARRMLAAV